MCEGFFLLDWTEAHAACGCDGSEREPPPRFLRRE